MAPKNKRQEFTVHFHWCPEFGVTFQGRENTGYGEGSIQSTWKKRMRFSNTLPILWELSMANCENIGVGAIADPNYKNQRHEQRTHQHQRHEQRNQYRGDNQRLHSDESQKN